MFNSHNSSGFRLHACGEYQVDNGVRKPPGRSPPRMWGILWYTFMFVSVMRFTPTYVGNTVCRRRTSFCRTVHPHVCGEYSWLWHRLTPWGGSPPRMWGIRLKSGQLLAECRFTPTYVGNTPEVSPLLIVKGGSPPRMWGIPGCPFLYGSIRRFTPTYVGNTGCL